MYWNYFQPSLIFVVKAKAHLALLLFELQQTELKTRDTEGRSGLFVKNVYYTKTVLSQWT